MGLLDDAASVISARTSHSKRSSKSHRDRDQHRSSRHSTYLSPSSQHPKNRERSRSGVRDREREREHERERDRSRHRSSRSTVAGAAAGGGGGLSGFAASIFGGGGDDDDGLSYGEDYSGRDKEKKRRRKERERERERDRGGVDEDGTRSFFGGLPSASRSSFFSNFGLGGGRHSPSSSSHYKRSPRAGFVSRMLKKLRRLLRDLLYYAKRHPLKVFLLLGPLLTTGALTALLAKFGLRLPHVVERMLGMAAKAGSGDSVGLVGEAVKMVSGAGVGAGGAAPKFARASLERGRGGVRWERRSLERDFYGEWGGRGW
ncbi:hypothetical protein N0V88_004866 [Collariella sp. IMI 366227]|nr:hypothetical protein N0V88_004866 [Collariella sp. IMI 366227]